MEKNLIRLSYNLAKCSFHQNPRKLTIIGMKFSPNYRHSISSNAKISKDATKVNRRKMKSSPIDRRISEENVPGRITEQVNFQKEKLSNEKITAGNNNNNTIKLPESVGEMLNKFSEENRNVEKMIDNREALAFHGENQLKRFYDVDRMADNNERYELDMNNVSFEDLQLFKERKKKHNVETFNHSLASYISASMYCGLYESAYETFNYFRNAHRESSEEGLNILPFNEVLKGIANKADLKKMKEVMISLEEASLKPDHNTIAYCLSCLGRNENIPSVIDEINNTLELMNQQSVTIDEVIGNASFPGDSLHYFILAIERVNKDIRDKLEAVDPTKDYLLKENSYNNELVNNLNKSLFTNQVESPSEGVVPCDKLAELIQRQFDNELKGYVEIPLINAEETTTEQNKLDEKLLNDWNEEWRKTFHEVLSNYKTFMSETFSDPELNQSSYFPYFNVLSNEDIVDLLLEEIKLRAMSGPLYKVCDEEALWLGIRFYRCFVNKYKEKSQTVFRNVYEKYCHSSLYRSDPDASYNPRVEWNTILAKENHTMNWKDSPVNWPYTVKLSIGRMLYNFIFENVKVWSYLDSTKKSFPGFILSNEGDFDRFKPSWELFKVFKSVYRNISISRADKVPMLSPPVPRTSIHNGGYCIPELPLITSSVYASQQSRLLEERGVQKLYPMMDSLNFVGSVPWKINCDMLDTIIKIYKSGGWPEVCICPSPNSLLWPEISDDMSMEEEKEALQYRHELKKIKRIWNDTQNGLSILNYFRNDVFWFPWHLDFRGRMYPLCDKMSYAKFPDSLRSTLCFAKGKKLGEGGLTWLKIHLVNLTGMKKLSSTEDQLQFAEEMMDEIFDSAKNPLDGNKWWSKCSEPFQSLAACKELVAALESECPEEYVSHLPIHQDGSCNVLQHYSALGRDEEGATYVNLCPSDTPNDMYSHIANLVEAKREKDARNGVEVAQSLEGLVKRNGIKQALLAMIYGGGKRAIHHGILRKQREMYELPEGLRLQALEYLETNISDSFSDLFPSFYDIKKWLRYLAKGVSQKCLSCVEFETPLGLHTLQSYVMQSYSHERPKEVISPYDTEFSLLPNMRNHKRSFAPNFIQSLEASHMMLTSLYCQEAGISFSHIHDCFLTHAATVPIMNKICREQFVNLYSQPILENLAEFMVEKYSTHPNYEDSYTMLNKDGIIDVSLDTLLKNIPPKGEFELNNVLRSVFFFS